MRDTGRDDFSFSGNDRNSLLDSPNIQLKHSDLKFICIHGCLLFGYFNTSFAYINIAEVVKLERGRNRMIHLFNVVLKCRIFKTEHHKI